MKEAYVKFETAQLLKEKGFDWSTHKLYGRCRTYNGELIDFDTECELKDEGLGDQVKDDYALYDMWWVASELDLGYPCPTQQMACKWLTEEKHIFIGKSFAKNEETLNLEFYSPVFNMDTGELITTIGAFCPEDAVEAALRYALANLI